MAPILVHNLTSDPISVSSNRNAPPTVVDPHSQTITQVGFCSKLSLARPHDVKHETTDTNPDTSNEAGAPVAATATAHDANATSLVPHAVVSNEQVTFRVKPKLFSSPSVQIALPQPSKWHVSLVNTSSATRTLAVIPNRNLASFLADIPDSTLLSACVLPGTHETLALYGWPISQCQTKRLPEQLANGIRVIDVRLAVRQSRLTAFHGIQTEMVPFQDVLNVLHTFLTSPGSTRETIVMSMKQEDSRTTPPEEFSKIVRQEMLKIPGGPDIFYLDNRIPTLGEVRGKIILLSRFGGDGAGWPRALEGMGLHPTPWPDGQRDGFTWKCKDTVVRLHDWYNIPSLFALDDKFRLSTSILLPPPAGTPQPNMAITFFSASQFPLAFPPAVALGSPGFEGMNSRVKKWLTQRLSDNGPTNIQQKRIRGWALMDFCDVDLVRMLVECNFKWRQHGEEGWV